MAVGKEDVALALVGRPTQPIELNVLDGIGDLIGNQPIIDQRQGQTPTWCRGCLRDRCGPRRRWKAEGTAVHPG
ncbi:hypothetical protein GCM10027615_36780 [Plantactinospora veratri]